MLSNNSHLLFPTEVALGAHPTAEAARGAFEAAFRRSGWWVSCIDRNPPRYRLFSGFERRGAMYQAIQDVTLCQREQDAWAALFGEVTETLSQAPNPPLHGVRPEIRGLQQALAVDTPMELALSRLVGIEEPLSDQEVAFLACLLPEAAGDSGLEAVAHLMVQKLQTAVSWPAVILADVPASSNPRLTQLNLQAVHALGLNGTWVRERHLPPDFPAALVPEARPKLTPAQTEMLGWRFIGPHRTALYDDGPNGWYEMWERVDNLNESVVVLLQQDSGWPGLWQEAHQQAHLFEDAPFDAVDLVQDPAFSNGDLDEEASGLSHLAELYGWKGVFDAVMVVLRDEQLAASWPTAAATLWCLQDHWDERRLGSEDVWIAHLHHAVDHAQGSFRPDEWHEFENLTWSITSKLKGIPYRSYYEPHDDPEVRPMMEELKRRANAEH